MQTQHWKIGELVQRTGYTAQAIRYYERERLLPAPARSDGNYRLYGELHLERLQFIGHCRSLGMALDDIRTLLGVRDVPEQSCDAVNAMLDKHIVQVAERIAALHSLERQLVALRSLCRRSDTASQCAILHSLGAEAH